MTARPVSTVHTYRLALGLPLLLLACSTEPEADPAAAAAPTAATQLCALFEAAGQSCTVDGSTARSDGRAVQVELSSGESVEAGGRALLDLRVDLSVNGQARPDLDCVAVGQGPDQEAALADGVQQWADRCGRALVDAWVNSGISRALGERDAKGELLSLQVGSWRAYPGRTTMRGALEGGPAGNHPMLLSFLAPALQDLPEPRPLLLQIELTVDGERVGSASCTIAEQDAPELCKAARGFPWPEGTPAYVVKQAYALVPAPTTERAARDSPDAEESAAPAREGTPAGKGKGKAGGRAGAAGS